MQRDRLTDYGLETICNDIADGMSLVKIAQQVGVSVGTVVNWLNAVPERSARVREVRALTAQLWDEKAQEVIENADDAIGIQRARELASHYRWRAKAINPRVYGDRVELAGEVGIRDLTDEQRQSRIAVLLRAAGAAELVGGRSEGEEPAPPARLLPGDGASEA